MKSILPILSFVLSVLVFCLKNIYGGYHWIVAKMYAIQSVNSKIKNDLISLNSDLFQFNILIALVSIMLTFYLIKNKLPNKNISILLFIVAVVGLLFVLIPM
jgi:hypothetical protein